MLNRMLIPEISRSLEQVKVQILKTRSFEDLSVQSTILTSLARTIIRDLEAAFVQASGATAA